MARILVVEDEGVVAWSIQEALEGIDHIVVGRVTSGVAAMQIVEEIRPDLVLIDIRLDGEMDGISTAEIIWGRWKIPFVYLAAHADETTLQRAIQTELFGYLVKPFRPKVLQTAIEVALRRYQLERNVTESEQRLAATLASIGDGTIAVDQNGRITFMNRVAETLTGWQQQEALGELAQQVLTLIHPETREVIENPLLRALREGMQVSLPGYCLLRAKDNTERLIEDSAAPIKNSQDEIVGSVLIFQDITDRQKAEETLRQQVERERLLGTIAQRIYQTLSLDEMLSVVVLEMQRSLQADRVLILQLSSNGSAQIVNESLASNYPATMGMRWTNNFLSPDAYEFYRQGHPRIVANITNDLWELHTEFWQRAGVQSQVIAPIRLRIDWQEESDDRASVTWNIWGLLVAQACTHLRQWQSVEAHFLQHVSNQMMIAMHQVERYQQLQREVVERRQAEHLLRQSLEREQRSIRQDRFIANIAQNIRQFLDLDYILTTTVEEVRGFLQVDRVIINRFETNWNGKVIAESTIDKSLSIFGQVMHESCFEEPYVETYRQGRIHSVGDVQTAILNPCYAEFLSQLQVRSLLVVPILVSQELWGLLSVHQCSSSRQWSQSTQYLLQQLSNQLAIGIYQTELYQRSQQQAQREQALNRVIQAIRNSLNLETVAATAATEIARLFHVERVCIIQYLPEQYLWRSVADYRQTPDLPSALGLEISDDGNELIAQIKRSGVVRIDDTSAVQNEISSRFVSMFPGALLIIPLHVGSIIWGGLCLVRNSEPSLWQAMEIEASLTIANQLAIAIQQSELYQQLQNANQRLQRLVTQDGLTQVASRRRFDEYLNQSWRNVTRDRSSLSLILCDVDSFKNYNDTYGHLAGDDCLIQIAQAISRAVKRSADLVARYGGEEFAIILPNTNSDGAVQVAQDIQEQIRQLNLPRATSVVSQQITLSFGIASIRPTLDQSPQTLIDRADRALYQAKGQGRNGYSVDLSLSSESLES